MTAQKRTKKSARAKQSGELQRYVVCNFCGEIHRHHGRDAAACRRRHRKGQGPAPSPPMPPPPRQRQRGDVLGGDQNAHTIARKLRAGWTPRKIAKYMGLPLDAVRDVITKIEGQS